MYPNWLVEWAGDLLRSEQLAVSRVNSAAPACQTGASCVRYPSSVCCVLVPWLAPGEEPPKAR